MFSAAKDENEGSISAMDTKDGWNITYFIPQLAHFYTPIPPVDFSPRPEDVCSLASPRLCLVWHHKVEN